MKFKKQKHVYFIAQTYIDLSGASVSVMCAQNNAWGQYWSSDLNDPHILYFDTEEKAKEIAYMWANTDMTVHGRYIDIE